MEYETFTYEGERYFKLRNIKKGRTLCRKNGDGTEVHLASASLILPVPGTTLGQIADGDNFRFGGIKFKRNFSSKVGSDELVSCRIEESTKTVHISVDAWVEFDG